MRILYKQRDGAGGESAFYKIGIENCYLKEITEVSDSKLVTKKEHSHTGYEIHIVTEGEQTYEIGGKSYRVSRESFIMIPPGVSHRVVSTMSGSFKYSLVFSAKSGSENSFFKSQRNPVLKECTCGIIDALHRISSEHQYARELSALLVENATFELVVSLLRLVGVEEERKEQELSDGNARIEMAKKYIVDNVEQNLSVSDVAAYCYLGEKQLTRLFRLYEKTSPAEHIRSVRTRRIECLLADRKLSIKEISRIMNFNNEYYFNAFFKKYYGMPPGEYRKTLSLE